VFTTTRVKTPVINNMNQLRIELADLITAENINLNGKEITTNGKSVSELEVKVVNGRGLPSTDELRKALGRLLAKHVKLHLKDTSQFNNYKTTFASQQTKSGVTKSNWISYTYSSWELTAHLLEIGKKLTSANGYPLGGSTFDKHDSEIVFVLTNFTLADTSAISLRLCKNKGNDQDNIAESHLNINANTDYLLNTMNVQQFYETYGAGEFQFQVLTHDTVIAAKDFSLK